jgi:hypothetical protein
MKVEDKIIRHIARKYNKDPRVVREIVYHPLLFAKRRMEDDAEDRPIRIRYFGAFTQKEIKNKEFIMAKRRDILLENLDEVYNAIIHTGRHDDMSKDDVKDMLEESDNLRGVVNDIWNVYQEYLK